MNPLPAPPRPRSRGSRHRLLAATGACLLAAGACGAVAATATSARAQAALSANWYESAPYYSTLDSSGPDLGQVMAATGQKAFEMASGPRTSGTTTRCPAVRPASGTTTGPAETGLARGASNSFPGNFQMPGSCR
jgi:hypothetical protein